MSDLFGSAAGDRLAAQAPLPERLRPRVLDDLVGQERVVGPGTALRRAIEEDRVGSLILFGPPGSGKTTLARIVAGVTGAAFEELSAVEAGKPEVRAVVERARERLGHRGQRTILFLDEIHRFSKAQQDALLPVVESGLLILIGATTENPYYEVNRALISRCAVYELAPLDVDALGRVLARGIAELGVEVDEAARARLLEGTAGDARALLAGLELAGQTARSRGVPVGLAEVEEALALPVRYDKDGDVHYDAASALIKSLRGSDPDAAIYWLAVMLAGGEDPKFIARRLVVFASEDVGNADPRGLELAVAVARAVEFIGMPECRINLAQGVTYLALAPKSNASYTAIDAALADVRSHGNRTPPDHIRDGSHSGSRSLGRGVGYRYPHAEGGFVADQVYLPPEIADRRFYEPTTIGFEARLAELLGDLRRRRGLDPAGPDAGGGG